MFALRPQELDCHTYGDLDRAIEMLVGDEPYRWLFRGHTEFSWRLAPRLERVCEIDDLLNAEEHMLTEFRSKAHLYAEHLPRTDDTLGWLSTMQHHGVPTRLLDWTYSAFVAMFFAIETVGQEGNGAIWAIDAEALDRVFQARARGILPPGSRPRKIGPEQFDTIAFRPAFEAESFGLVGLMLPSFHVSRLSSQQGCFLINCNYRMKFEESLADMMEQGPVSWLFRITFSQSIRLTCLRRLMHFNVHPATLFPDLEGLARFIAMKNELFPVHAEPAEQPSDPTDSYRLMAARSARNILRRTGKLDSTTIRRAYDHALSAIMRAVAQDGSRFWLLDQLQIRNIVAAATVSAAEEEYLVLRPSDRPTPEEFESLKDSLRQRSDD